MTQNTSSAAEMAALAAEVCDLWQKHLAQLSADPAAKADFMQLMEPQRQAFSDMFADYAAMMQHSPHGNAFTPNRNTPEPAAATNAPHGTAPAAAASDDSSLRLAQLAHRVAALEERISRLESKHESRASRRAPPPDTASGDERA